jgi:branched-chain amino acid transport system permease protein
VVGFSITSASLAFPTSPISSCSCRWCWCSCSGRRACSAGCRREAQRSRPDRHRGRAHRDPVVVRNEFYLNLASQILIYALLAVSLNLLPRLWRHGLARSRVVHRADQLCGGAAAERGFGQLFSAILAIVFSTLCGALFGLLALRASGIGFLMITLALGRSSGVSPIGPTPSPKATTASALPRARARSGSTSPGAASFYWFT